MWYILSFFYYKSLSFFLISLSFLILLVAFLALSIHSQSYLFIPSFFGVKYFLPILLGRCPRLIFNFSPYLRDVPLICLLRKKAMGPNITHYSIVVTPPTPPLPHSTSFVPGVCCKCIWKQHKNYSVLRDKY